MPNPILDLAAQFRAQALQRERAAATALVRAYGQVYRNLDPQIRALEEALRGLENPRPVDIQKLASLRVLKEQTIEQVNRYAAYADTTIAGEVQANIAVGLRDSEALVQAHFDPAWLQENGLVLNTDVQKALRASWVRVPSEAVETMVGMTQADSPLRQALVHNLGDVVAQQMVDALITGIATGKNPRVIAREQMGAGLNYSLTTARTAQLWAYREATRANYRANRDIVSGWRWSATFSARTCASCLAMHGTIHSVDEPLNDHHNGRCSQIPIVPLAAQLGIPEPDMGDAEAWLKAQPESVQQEMLGKGVYEGYKGGKWGLKDLTTTYEDGVYGTMRRPPTLTQLNGGHRSAPLSQPQVPSPQPQVPNVVASAKTFRSFDNEAEMYTWAQSAFGTLAKSDYAMDSIAEAYGRYTEDERSAINHYISDGYDIMNRQLRFGERNLHGDHIKNLKSAIRKNTLPEDISVFRGFVSTDIADAIRSGADIRGMQIVDKGFMSTSLNPRTASGFANGRTDSFVMKINLQKGTKILPMPMQTEHEMLLPPGTRVRVIGQSNVTYEIAPGVTQTHSILEMEIVSDKK